MAKLEFDENRTLDTMLHQILNLALVAIGAEAGSLMLADHQEGILQIKARLGKPRKGRRSEPVFQINASSVAGRAVITKQPCYCSNIDNDANFEPSRSGINFRSLLAVPIVHEGRAIAVINADSDRPNDFTDDDIRTLQDVADTVAIPIAKRMSVIKALAQIGKDLVRTPRVGGIDLVLKNITDLAVESLGADIVTLYQYDQDRDEFLVEGTGPTISGTLHHEGPMRTRIYQGDVPRVVAEDRRPGFYRDLNEHSFLTQPIDRPGADPRPRFVEREGIRSMASLLLPNAAARSEGQELVGIMFANYRTEHDFNIDERQALETFADYAAVAILNARLEEQRAQERLRLVLSISNSLAHQTAKVGNAMLKVANLKNSIEEHDHFAQQTLNEIVAQGQNLHALTQALMTRYSLGREGLKLSALALEQTVLSALDVCRPEEHKIEVKREFPSDLPRIAGDSEYLRQVLIDLITNSIESINERREKEGEFHGRLLFRARLEDSTEGIELYIIDNGIGLDSMGKKRMFLPGETKKAGHLGIGLWCCKTFVEACGGRLFVSDEQPTVGATFVIELQQRIALSAPTSEPSILIVEDDLSTVKHLEVILSEFKYDIDSALTLDEAKTKLANRSYRLLVLDLSLRDIGEAPEAEGLELLDFVAEHRVDTRVIILTLYANLVNFPSLKSQYPFLVACIDKGVFDRNEFLDHATEALQSL